MTITTRLQIIAFLDKYPSVSSDEISRAMGMSKVNIQYHLKKMLNEGVVRKKREPLISRSGPGHPTYLYYLDIDYRPTNIPDLAEQLLQLIFATLETNDAQNQFLMQLAQQMFSPHPFANLTHNLNHAVQQLNQHNYQASWEARQIGPRITFSTCPYASILNQHPELCRLDSFILERILARPVNQIAKLNMETRKPPVCIFTVELP
jgi:predicted ArsR family transcriptional regulator